MILKKKNNVLYIIAWLLSLNSVFAQTLFTTSGNWEDSGNWLAGDIGDVITDNVNLNTGTSALYNSPTNFTIGNLVFGNGAALAINAGAILNVGQLGTPKDVTANNTATINVAGDLIIWGDLTVNTQLTFNVTGTVIIHGSIIMNDGARLFATGTLTVDGDFTGGDDTDVTILGSGFIDIAGTLTVGNESQLTGPNGSIHAHACNQGLTNSTFCGSATLPVKLLYFKSEMEGDVVSLIWATESESSFAYFEIERAAQDLQFFKLTEVPGAGYNTITKQEYSMVDHYPFTGLNYYRLKAVDVDGSFEYFNVVSAKVESTRAIEVYPNPVAGEKLTYKIDFNPTPADQILLMDIHGRQVLSTEVVSFGVNEIELKNLAPPGLYLLKYTSPAFQKTLKVIVR